MLREAWKDLLVERSNRKMRVARLLLLMIAALMAMVQGSCVSDNDSGVENSADKTDRSTTSTIARADDDNGEVSDRDSTSDQSTEDTVTTESPMLDSPLVDELTASLIAMPDATITEDSARCYAREYIRIVGADRIEEGLAKVEDTGLHEPGMAGLISVLSSAGVIMTEDEAFRLYDAAKGCGMDFRTLMFETAAAEELPAPIRDCLEGVLTDDASREFWAAVMTEGMINAFAGRAAPIVDDMMACEDAG